MKNRITFSVVARLASCLSVLASTSIALTSPASMQRAFYAAGGPAGWALLGALLGLAVLGVLDIALNDVAPAGWRWRRLEHARTRIYTTVSLLLIAVAAVSAMRLAMPALLLRYGVDGGMALLVAWVDLHERHRRGVLAPPQRMRVGRRYDLASLEREGWPRLDQGLCRPYPPLPKVRR